MTRALLVVLLLVISAGCAHSRREDPTSVASAVTMAADSLRAGAIDSGQGRYAWAILERRCQQCHALPDPRKHTREKWVKGIAGMRRRFTLPAADWDSLLALVPADTAASMR